MKSIIIFTLLLFLISHNKKDESEITSFSNVEITNNVINDNFGGVGFHVFYHIHNAPKWQYEQILAKRWRELNPSFVRITDNPTWDTRKLDTIATYLEVMKDTETEMYFTSWGAQNILTYPDEKDYVKHEVDNLEYLKTKKGFNRINYYCMANELSLDRWASMVQDLEYFKRIQGLFYNEISDRNLEIKMLATDASPFSNWYTIGWAAENMDEITGVYGGHHYINSYDLFDLNFYSFFLHKMKWGAGIARNKNKNFIVGEFGAKQNSNIIDSIRHDACIYNNTPLEKYMGIQIAEAIIAMINGGVYACNNESYSIAIVNRHENDRRFNLALPVNLNNMKLRKYEYNSSDVPFNYFGDLQPHVKRVVTVNSILQDTIPALSLVVYTTNYDDTPPGKVRDLNVERRKIAGRDKTILNWSENKEKDLCYYRIYRSEKSEVEISAGKQIASTITNQYIDQTVHNLPRYYYKVIAVDQSGNASE